MAKDQRMNFDYLNKTNICATLSQRKHVTKSSTGAGSPGRQYFAMLPINASDLHYWSSVIVEQVDNYRKQAEFAKVSSTDVTFSHTNVKVLKFLCARGKVVALSFFFCVYMSTNSRASDEVKLK